jgi:release factor glutamine methyltransferase
VTGSQALREAVARLQAAGVEGAARDARRLLAHALGVAPDLLAGRLADPLPEAAAAEFTAFVARRAGREPVSHITGRRAFWGRDFRVTPEVLDPRPETETLVALALEAPFARVLDLGTGSGCILVTLLAERPGTTGVGTDISPAALLIAGENAARHGVADRLILTPSDWFGDIGGQYDLIVSNPPYIAAEEMASLAPEVLREPRGALTDEGDGLAAYRAIAGGAGRFLAPGGRLLVEIGPVQGEAVSRLLAGAGLEGVAIHPDLDGRDRVVSARRPHG